MRILPFGESAALVRLEPVIDPVVLGRVLALDRAAQRTAGVTETVPAFASLLVFFDRERTSFAGVSQLLSAGSVGTVDVPRGRSHQVPVVYGGALGPDLGDVARWAGVSADEVIRLHTGTEYRVYALGFAPGFAYMGIVPDRIAAPRLPRPRRRVPVGAVGIAGNQTGIYPAATPGGWRIIGRTPAVLFDPQREPPTLFQIGDTVHFVPVPGAAWDEPDSPRLPAVPGERAVLVVLRPGLHTTVQDRGRTGSRRYGVPPSGAMDQDSLARANTEVGNPPEAAGIECAWPGPVLEALGSVTVALTGADFTAEVDGRAVQVNRAIEMRRGQVLGFRSPRRGMWAYVAVQGGIDVVPVMGSRSTLVRSGLGGLSGRTLRAADILCAGPGLAGPTSIGVHQPQEAPIRLLLGPHPEAFAPDALERFVRSCYEVSVHSDRAGYRLDGPAVEQRGSGEILSQGMVPGAIQVPPDGQPIVLMPDGPTVGGYPVLAVVAERDLGRLAQLRPGEGVEFSFS